MIYLCDNDFAKKMVLLDLWPLFLESLDSTESDVRILPTFVARYRHQHDLWDNSPDTARKRAADPKKEQLTKADCKRLLRVIERLAIIEDDVPLEYESVAIELADIHGVDGGEAHLAVMAASNRDSLLLTGDKRFLKALHGSKQKRLKSRLKGRVMCIEVACSRIVQSHGLEVVCELVCNRPGLDQSLDAIFPSKGCKPRNTKEAFAHYWSELAAIPFLCQPVGIYSDG